MIVCLKNGRKHVFKEKSPFLYNLKLGDIKLTAPPPSLGKQIIKLCIQWSPENSGLQKTVVSRKQWSPENSGLQKTVVSRKQWSPENSGLQKTVVLQKTVEF